MKESEQRIALCEWAGWKWTDGSGDYTIGWLHPLGGSQPGESFNGKRTKEECAHLLPDTNSLDVLHEMVKRANFDDDTFLENLATIVSGKKCYKVSEANPWNFIEATAPQWREALLRTIGKWSEPHGNKMATG